MKFFSFFLFFVLTNAALAIGPQDGVCTIISLHPTRGEIGMGTGFVFQETPDEYRVMTAEHVIMKHPNINHVAIFHELGYHAYILEKKTYDESRDLAILGFKKRKDRHYVFKLAPDYSFKKGERALAMTVSPADALTMKWIYFGMPNPGSDHELLFHGGGTKGNSGGPILNAKQQVVGILTKVSGSGNVISSRVPSVVQKAVPVPEARTTQKALIQNSLTQPLGYLYNPQVIPPMIALPKQGTDFSPPVSPLRDVLSDSSRK